MLAGIHPCMKGFVDLVGKRAYESRRIFFALRIIFHCAFHVAPLCDRQIFACKQLPELTLGPDVEQTDTAAAESEPEIEFDIEEPQETVEPQIELAVDAPQTTDEPEIEFDIEPPQKTVEPEIEFSIDLSEEEMEPAAAEPEPAAEADIELPEVEDLDVEELVLAPEEEVPAEALEIEEETPALDLEAIEEAALPDVAPEPEPEAEPEPALDFIEEETPLEPLESEIAAPFLPEEEAVATTA